MGERDSEQERLQREGQGRQVGEHRDDGEDGEREQQHLCALAVAREHAETQRQRQDADQREEDGDADDQVRFG